MTNMFQENFRKVLLIGGATLVLIIVWNLLVHAGVLVNGVVSGLLVVVGLLLVACVVQADNFAKSGFERGALEERLGYRSDLVEVMTASEPRSIILADKWERVLFANREAASRVHKDSDSLIGSTLAALIGDKKAKLTGQRLQTAYKNKMPVIQVDEESSGMLRKIVQTSFMPIGNTRYIKDAVLITETDITSIIIERERREKTLRDLLDVCVAIIDKRDPFASGHSSLVGDIARRIAVEMKLDDSYIETAEISGLLMNFGKVLVPRDILTKTSALTPEELRLVRDSMMSSADVLSLIQFELPVVDTLRQIFEKVDGTGLPDGRKSDSIIITARVCNAANSFVALVSRRAHREGLPIEQALSILRKDAGTTFDPQVIKALETVASNEQMQKQIARLATERGNANSAA